MALDLHRLELFVEIANEMNVTRAASHLHLSQQALSSSLREFERQLGVSLFDRAGGRLRLTAAGRHLLSESESILSTANDVVDRIRQHRADSSSWQSHEIRISSAAG